MAKHIERTFGEGLSVSASADKVLGRGHTGRHTHVGDGFRLAQTWSALAKPSDLRSHPAADQFRSEIKTVPLRPGSELLGFRGRLDDGSVRNWEHMGPPPTPQDSRYSSDGQVALYLCNSEAGVHKELCPRDGECRIFLQEYILPLTPLRFADFAGPDLSEFVSAAFDMAEGSHVCGRVGRGDFLFSQLLADLVRESEFQGMLVPGVRGDKACQYLNIVVFDPPAGRDWRLWSRKGSGFRRVVT